MSGTRAGEIGQDEGRRDVQTEVVQMLTEVMGEDFLLEVEVGPETQFTEDLALESIEFVTLMDKLRRHYTEVDFPAFIAGMELEQLITLKVGDVVGHIESVLGNGNGNGNGNA